MTILSSARAFGKCLKVIVLKPRDPRFETAADSMNASTEVSEKHRPIRQKCG